MINFENIGEKFVSVVHSEQWKELQNKFNDCDDIYILGHGGNLAVADHAAIDITRLSNGSKNAMCPGSGVVATSLINDTNFDEWMVSWLNARTTTRTVEQMKRSLVIGISSSGTSKDVVKALEWGKNNGMQICAITSMPFAQSIEGLTEVILGVEYYHTAEVLTLLLTYQLTHGSGNECPAISKKREETEALNWKGGKIRQHSYPDEKTNISIDFDGVIHKCSKGFYDGTIYDEPVENVALLLSRLSEKYSVVITTCKARKDRGLVNGKTGTQLVWEWLEKNDLAKFVSLVTAEKPRAVCYIDDKAVKFTDPQDMLIKLEEMNIL